jgi:predicted permease
VTRIRIFLSRARRLWGGDVNNGDFQQEISSHLAEAIEDYVRQGCSPAEARQRALVEFGGVTQAQEAYRDEGSFAWLDAAWLDLREAVRGLRAGKGTIALAFAILTLTLAAGTVTFSVVDAVALRPLPFANPEGLIAIARPPQRGGMFLAASPQNYFSLREGTRSFERLAAAWGGTTSTLVQGETTHEVLVARTTADLFDVLGVRPILGRTFRSDEETPGRDGVVILGHGLWVRSFNSDPAVIGRQLILGQRQSKATYEIVGVLPAGVSFPITASTQPVEVFRPYVAAPSERDQSTGSRGYGLHIVGRLRPGVTVEQARIDVARVTASLRSAYPQIAASGDATLVLPLLDRVVGRAKSWLILLLAAVGCVVLVGCVNAASLLLARVTVRSREFATRAALGASRSHIARTLLAEGLLLTCASTAAALGLSVWGIAFAKANLPPDIVRTSSIATDARVLVASFAAALLCGLFAGGVPAWRIVRSDLIGQLKAGGGVVSGRRQTRMLGAFLSAEVAFVTVLLVATTLVVTTFVLITTADLGIDRRNVMTIRVSKSLPGVSREARHAATQEFFRDVLDRAQAVPGVLHVAMIAGGSAPLGGGSTRYSLIIPGVGDLQGDESLETRRVSSDYFAAMGVSLLKGRAFTEGDRTDSPPVAIVNDLAARRYFPGRDPVGQTVTFQNRETRIVGVAENVRLDGPEGDLRTELYIPMAQEPTGADGDLVVRTATSAPLLASSVRDAIRPAMAGRVVSEARFVDDAFRRLTAARRFNAGLMSIFGALAMIIGAIGIYGTMAFVVVQQTRAIGLRMALGASQSDVLRSVLRESLWRVVVGVTIGVVVARSVANVFTSLVFGVQTTSVAVYVGVAAGMAAMAVLAALVPARRAARLDPLVALRAD